jgi:nucleotide-binding universal stress UspA family protein
LLAVPAPRSALDHVLLAFDGSAKAREALFICAYLAGAWGSTLTVLTVEDNRLPKGDALGFARQYLEFHEVQATIVTEAGNAAEVIAARAAADDADVVAMGGYGRTPLMEVVVGSVVNQILPLVHRPILICR